MDVHGLGSNDGGLGPVTPERPAYPATPPGVPPAAPPPAPGPAPARKSTGTARRVLIGLGAVLVVVAAASAGAAVADDGDEVVELQDQVDDLERSIGRDEEEIEALEAELARAEADTDDAGAAAEACQQAMTEVDALVAHVNELSDAWRRFQVTPVGSPEEQAALQEMDSRLFGLPAAVGGAEAAVAVCQPDG